MKNPKLILSIAIVIMLFFLGKFSGLEDLFSLEALKVLITSNPVYSYPLFILFFCIGNILQIPGWIFLAAAIYTLGIFNGYLLTLAAALTSVVFGYYFIKFFGGSAIRRLDSNFVNKLLSKLDKYPIRTNILLRTCFQTAPQLNYSLALSGAKFKPYFFGACLGLPIPIYIYTLFID